MRELRLGVGAARYVVVVDRLHGVAGNPLREQNAFHRRDMRELVVRAAHRDHVANGRDAWHVGLEQRIDDHVAAVHRQADGLGAQAFGHRTTARGDQQQVVAQLL